jgi:flagellar biosynthesis protein FlhF
MVTRKFKAPNMLAALQEVQRVLGPDAIVVSMRQIPAGPVWQVWKKPGCEVIATLPEKPAQPAPSEYARPANKPAAGNAAAKPGGRETIEWVIPELDKKTEPAQARPAAPKPAAGQSPAAGKAAPTAGKPNPAEAIPTYLPSENTLLGRTRAHLINQGLDSGLIDQIVLTCRDSLSPSSLVDEKRLIPYMQKQFEIRLKTMDKSLLNINHRVLAVVGPNGAGKTSACAKMASATLKEGKSVAWIGADTTRTAAISEARMYTDSMGIPLYTAYTTEDVKFSLQQSANADLILIDTTGCSPLDEESLVEMGALIADIPNRTTLLVMPAANKETDLTQELAAFGTFNLKGVFVTKMDETNAFGSLYNALWRSQVPLAYYSTGSLILDSLKQGNPAFLVNAMFNGGISR